MSILIRRPQTADIPQINRLFELTIQDTYEQEGIWDSLKESALEEIATLQQSLQADLNSAGEAIYFLIAVLDQQVVGTTAHGPPGPLISEHIAIASTQSPEIKCVYILPDFQNRGIGTALFKTMLKRLHEIGRSDFYLDSGYIQAQQFWTRKLGPPTKILEQFWDNDSDHLIWYRQVEDYL